MGFFKDFKDDFSQALSELLPGDDFTEDDGVRHTVWKIDDLNTIHRFQKEFDKIYYFGSANSMEERILKDYKETDKKIKNISKAIGNGTLFDEENKELLNYFISIISYIVHITIILI